MSSSLVRNKIAFMNRQVYSGVTTGDADIQFFNSRTILSREKILQSNCFWSLKVAKNGIVSDFF